jgi:hypothetical protein
MKTSLFLLSLVSIASTACAEDKQPAKSDQAMTQPKVDLPESEWKKRLTEEQYRVTRTAGTERPNGAEYEKFNKQGDGIYYCVCCGLELFTSNEKLPFTVLKVLNFALTASSTFFASGSLLTGDFVCANTLAVATSNVKKKRTFFMMLNKIVRKDMTLDGNRHPKVYR